VSASTSQDLRYDIEFIKEGILLQVIQRSGFLNRLRQEVPRPSLGKGAIMVLRYGVFANAAQSEITSWPELKTKKQRPERKHAVPPCPEEESKMEQSRAAGGVENMHSIEMIPTRALVAGAVNHPRVFDHIQLPTLDELGIDRNAFLPTVYSDTALATATRYQVLRPGDGGGRGGWGQEQLGNYREWG